VRLLTDIGPDFIPPSRDRRILIASRSQSLRTSRAFSSSGHREIIAASRGSEVYQRRNEKSTGWKNKMVTQDGRVKPQRVFLMVT
jgi:hypothetical protein